MVPKALLDLPDRQDTMVPKASLVFPAYQDTMAPRASLDPPGHLALPIWVFALTIQEPALALLRIRLMRVNRSLKLNQMYVSK